MKKSVWAASLLGVIVAAGGGWLAVHILETKTEQAVRDVLAEVSASADTVEYDLLGNTLRLGHVAYAMDLAGQLNETRIEDVTLTGFDRACLDPVSGPELPLVADSVVAAGLAVSSSGNVNSQGSVAEMRVEGWRQNLGKLAELYRQEPWSEAFFAEAYRYRVEMMAYKDYRVSIEAPDRKPITMSMAMAGLLGPAGSPDAGGESGRTLSVFLNDLNMDRPGLGATAVKRMELHDMLLPPSAAASRLMAATQELQAAQAGESEAARELVDTMFKALGDAYLGATPYEEIVINSYEFRPEEEGAKPLRVDQIRNRLSLADPFVFGLDVSGFHGDWESLPEEFQRAGRAFLPGGFLADNSIQVSLRPEAGDSSVEWSAGVRDLGRFEGQCIFNVKVKEFGEVLTLSSSRIMDRILLKNADAVYTDQGLTALALFSFAQAQGESVEELRNHLVDELPSLGRQAGALGSMLERAAAVMLDKPGTVRVQCRPPAPLPLPQASMAVMFQPQALNLTVSAEPGDKALLDWLPASLKQ